MKKHLIDWAGFTPTLDNDKSWIANGKDTNSIEFESKGKTFFSKIIVEYAFSEVEHPSVSIDGLDSDVQEINIFETGSAVIKLAHPKKNVKIYHKWVPESTVANAPARIAPKDGFEEHGEDGLTVTEPGTFTYYATNGLQTTEEKTINVISKDTTTTALTTISADGAKSEYFDLMGRKVETPAAGSILIERKGAEVRKVIVK